MFVLTLKQKHMESYKAERYQKGFIKKKVQVMIKYSYTYEECTSNKKRHIKMLTARYVKFILTNGLSLIDLLQDYSFKYCSLILGFPTRDIESLFYFLGCSKSKIYLETNKYLLTSTIESKANFI